MLVVDGREWVLEAITADALTLAVVTEPEHAPWIAGAHHWIVPVSFVTLCMHEISAWTMDSRSNSN